MSGIHPGAVHRLRNGATQLALNGLGVVLVLIFDHQFHFNTASVLVLYLLVVMLLSLAGGLFLSAIVSVVAAASVAYYFLPPILSFRIDDPLNVVAFLILFVVALVINRLASQVHRALRDNEQRLKLAESAAHLAIWDRDLRTNVIAISGDYARLYGLAADHASLSYWDWLGLVHPDDRERVRALQQETLQRTHVWDAEFRVVWPDGSVHWLLGKGEVFFDDAGLPARITGVNLDITDRKQAEAALRESEERFRNMADTAPVMICASGPDKLATFFNTGWLTFTGRSMEQELGYGWTEGVHSDDLDDCLARYSSSFDAHRNCHIEYRLRRADGEYRSIVYNGAPRFASGGVFAGYIASCIDITDLKRAQEEALARQKLESLGILAGGIAHDFNNLLGGILAEAELVEADLPAGSSPVAEIQRIKAVAIRGAEIVRALMTYAGQNQANLVESVNVSRLTEEMLELLKVSISKHAVLKIDLDHNLPAVWGNAPQIRQVVMNLVINASEAIGEKEGVISVTTRHVRGGRDLAPNSAIDLPEGDYVRLEVSDTGCGITEVVRAKIFDPFFSTKFTGRGLGLAVVQGTVRDHGGAINLASVLGQGTRFQVLLPCANEPSNRDGNANDQASADETLWAAATVLLVEDEDTLRLSVSELLRKKGFSVVEAANGSAAVNLLYSYGNSIDLILLDLTTPGASSHEVVAEAQRIRPGIKVVLTSAYSREMVANSLDLPQVSGFIRKPFQFADLVKLLRGTLAPEAQYGSRR